MPDTSAISAVVGVTFRDVTAVVDVTFRGVTFVEAQRGAVNAGARYEISD